jgi:hypothetical protein
MAMKKIFSFLAGGLLLVAYAAYQYLRGCIDGGDMLTIAGLSGIGAGASFLWHKMRK